MNRDFLLIPVKLLLFHGFLPVFLIYRIFGKDPCLFFFPSGHYIVDCQR